MVWYFIGVYVIKRTLHGRLEIRNFSSSVEKYFTSERSRWSILGLKGSNQITDYKLTGSDILSSFLFSTKCLNAYLCKFCESVAEEKCYLNAFEPFPFPQGIISF